MYAIIATGLFALVFITKKRFGLLGFALAAGSILSGIWVRDVELIINKFGFSNELLTAAVIGSIIVMLPSFILLFHAHGTKKLIGRIISAALFSILAITFLIDPISHVLMPNTVGIEVYNLFISNRNLIIGLGLIIATVDLFLTKSAKSSEKKSKH